jgi:hypothetical protein
MDGHCHTVLVPQHCKFVLVVCVFYNLNTAVVAARAMQYLVWPLDVATLFSQTAGEGHRNM